MLFTASLLSLLFPEVCRACRSSLMTGEQMLCMDCRSGLPRTGFHNYFDNPVHKVFVGRLPLRAATSLFYYKKQSKVQNLIHTLKYKGQRELAVQLGNMMGTELSASRYFTSTELIVPVPLHQDKLKIRGYNQSEGFAQGIKDVFGRETKPDALGRIKHTATQTKKNRTDRWENVKEVFVVAEPESVYNRNILLVDDVVTTGATIEACSNSLYQAGAASVSIATIAYAEI